jgi:hypothetical protein
MRLKAMFGSTRRTVLLVVTSAVAALCVLWMQGRFEAADSRHARTIVQDYRSKAGVSIPDVLSQLHPGKGIQWAANVQSSCFQHIEIHASVNADPSKGPLVYVFIVDLNGPAIHPGNEAGQRLLKLLDKPLARSVHKQVNLRSPRSASAQGAPPEGPAALVKTTVAPATPSASPHQP